MHDSRGVYAPLKFTKIAPPDGIVPAIICIRIEPATLSRGKQNFSKRDVGKRDSGGN